MFPVIYQCTHIIPGLDTDGGVWRLVRFIQQPLKCTEGGGPPLAYPGEKGRGCEDVGSFIYRSHPGDIFIWVRYMGGDPMHDADPGGFHHRVARHLTVKYPK